MGVATQESDSTSLSLIERACQQDSIAWNRLSLIYGPLIYRWSRRAGLQEADAADVLQNVFRALVTGIDKFQPEKATGGFRGWLYGISSKKIIDHFRAQKKQGIVGDVNAEEIVATLANPTESEQAEEEAIVVNAALEQIQPEFEEHNWQAFCRTVLNEEAAVDVAKDLNMTSGAVRQAKFRILKRLRGELDGW